MAKKTLTQTIEVETVKFNEIGKMLKSEKGKDYENILSALIAIQQTIDELKIISKPLQEIIDNTPVEDVKAQLIARGKLAEGRDPVFRIPLIDKNGKITDTFIVTLNQSEHVEFNISKDLKDSLSIVPERYKKEQIVLKRDVIKDDYHAGSLDSVIEPYVSETKTLVTKVKKDKVYDEDAK